MRSFSSGSAGHTTRPGEKAARSRAALAGPAAPAVRSGAFVFYPDRRISDTQCAGGAQ